ncbi:hypothetical protein NQ318_021200 [Aromia moschata]|uniref:MiT/TFE transcription factors N-terminal domain-containing protein n=1 Tax=Aromia moschata TaxID=1265417 RepID=A0AAV8YHQ5_9CUCU|nr:hypothetical protein NQ318_021200 [Aromia moschata]
MYPSQMGSYWLPDEFAASAPDLKTATTLSRTQLKLQLMRDHAMMEQQRQAQERAVQQQNQQLQNPQPTLPPAKVPLHSLEMPPQVLQTGLEKPTRYNVLEKQTHQVKQYLSESFQVPGCGPLLSGPNQTQSAPTTGTSSIVPNAVTTDIPHSQPYRTPENVSPNFDIPILSPALSSGATSTSEIG